MDLLKNKNIKGYLTMSRYNDPFYYEYFTIKAIENGEIGITLAESYNTNIKYSKNNGAWTSHPSTNILVVSGDEIRFKYEYIESDFSGGDWGFSINSTASFDVYGNIMSLINSDEFKTNSEFPSFLFPEIWEGFAPFEQMFSENNNIKSAANLCLPASNLPYAAYSNMFSSSSVESAPKLYSATVRSYCYFEMFAQCSKLSGEITVPEIINIIKCLNLSNELSFENCFQGMFSIDSDLIAEEIHVNFKSSLHRGFWDYDGNIYDLLRNRSDNNTCNIFVPWEGISDPQMSNSTDFTARLKYFASERHLLTDGQTYTDLSFTVLDDVLGESMEISNINVLEYNIGGSHINIIEPLKYFIQKPFTIQAINTCEISLTPRYNDTEPFEFSLNGESWQPLKGNVIVAPGQEISFRTTMEHEMSSEYDPAEISESSIILSVKGRSMDLTESEIIDNWDNHVYGNPNACGESFDSLELVSMESEKTVSKFNVYGNIMSIVTPNFTAADTIPYRHYFNGFFAGMQIQDASNLVLPAINLTNYCYREMFRASTLVLPPSILPKKNFSELNGCYYAMFRYCKNLIKTPILMIATTNEEGEYGEEKQSYNLCMDMFSYTNLIEGPELRQFRIQDGGYNYARMCYGCENIQTMKLYIHGPRYNYSLYNFIDFGSTQVLYTYDTFLYKQNNIYVEDLGLSSAGIGYISYTTLVNLHSNPTDENTPEEDTTYKIYISYNNKLTEIDISEYINKYEVSTWEQYLYSVNYYITLNKTNTTQVEFSINKKIISADTYYYISNAFDTPNGSGVYQYTGTICNSTNERDVVLSRNILQPGKIYYINRWSDTPWV